VRGLGKQVTKLEWFPFYAIRWLLSQQLRDSSLAEKGAYMDLLAFQWRDGSVPLSISSACRLVGAVTQEEQEAVTRVLDRFFSETTDGRAKNEWLEQVRLEQIKKLQQKSEAGKLGNDIRWQKHRTAIAPPSQPESDRNRENILEVDLELEVEKENTIARSERKFDLLEIYQAFPRKVGKAKGLEKLKALVKTQQQFADVLQAARRYAADMLRERREEKHIAHFSTWVSQQRWQDEPSDAKASSIGTAPQRPKYRDLTEIYAEQEAIKNGNDPA
jgi:uncharacterized protein YdaU (DUF1376 family)